MMFSRGHPIHWMRFSELDLDGNLSQAGLCFALDLRLHTCLEHSTSYLVSSHKWHQDREYFYSRPWHLMMVLVNLNGSFLRNGLFLVLFLHFLNVTLLLPFI